MATIGFIVNPYSGKDVRRIVSSATVVDNLKKVSIAERISSALALTGEHELVFMRDGYELSYSIEARLKHKGMKHVSVLPMLLDETHADTTEFVRRMNEAGCDLFVVLGGDGTSRAAAKTVGDTPMLSVSTGTNNVYPQFCEGTVAGMAAAAIVSGIVKKEVGAPRCKRIEYSKNGEFLDIALIDAVLTGLLWAGSKAIWKLEDMDAVLVSQSHPASIGFSSLAGAVKIITPEDPFGMMISLTTERLTHRAAIASGSIVEFGVEKQKLLKEGTPYRLVAKKEGMVAFDGEREQRFHEGDELSFVIERNGPYKVDALKTVALAQRAGMFSL